MRLKIKPIDPINRIGSNMYNGHRGVFVESWKEDDITFHKENNDYHDRCYICHDEPITHWVSYWGDEHGDGQNVGDKCLSRAIEKVLHDIRYNFIELYK